MTNEFYAIKKQHLVLVLGMVGIAATLSMAAILAFPVQTALSDHTGDDVVCPISHCVGGKDIAANAVTSGKIKDGAVKTGDIRDRTITIDDIGADTIRVPIFFNSGSIYTIGDTVEQTKFLGLGDMVAGSNAQKGNAVVLPLEARNPSLIAVVTTPPGAGETITVTVQVDFTDTTLSCTITGALPVCVDDFAGLLAGAGDQVGIKVVSSAGAANTRIQASIEFGNL